MCNKFSGNKFSWNHKTQIESKNACKNIVLKKPQELIQNFSISSIIMYESEKNFIATKNSINVATLRNGGLKQQS